MYRERHPAEQAAAARAASTAMVALARLEAAERGSTSRLMESVSMRIVKQSLNRICMRHPSARGDIRRELDRWDAYREEHGPAATRAALAAEAAADELAGAGGEP